MMSLYAIRVTGFIKISANGQSPHGHLRANFDGLKSRKILAATQSEILDTLQRKAQNPFIDAGCDMQINPVLPDDIKAANNIQGNVSFYQYRTGSTLTVWGTFTGLDTTGAIQHGLHVHEFGDITTNGCNSAGGHYNPFGKQHGGRSDSERHVGDFGNVERSSVSSDLTQIYFENSHTSLVGENTIIGKALVLDVGTDDLGLGGEDDSLTTGHAGARLACCVITEIN